MVCVAVFRLYSVKKRAKQQLAARKKRAQASTIIQTYFRMWKAKTLYKQLTDYKGQKETQLIYFGQQVCCYRYSETPIRHGWDHQYHFFLTKL